MTRTDARFGHLNTNQRARIIRALIEAGRGYAYTEGNPFFMRIGSRAADKEARRLARTYGVKVDVIEAIWTAYLQRQGLPV